MAFRFALPIAPTIRATLLRHGKRQSSSWNPIGTRRCRYPRYARSGGSNPSESKTVLLPVLAAAFILSQRRDVAFYRQSIFQARVTDLDMDYLAKDLRDVQLRWMDLSEASRQLLSDMAGIVRTMDEDNTLPDLEPIDVAKGLVSIHDRLPPWVGRTQHLSSNAKRVRQLFKQASDPNSLIFDDIPRLLSDGFNDRR